MIGLWIVLVLLKVLGATGKQIYVEDQGNVLQNEIDGDYLRPPSVQFLAARSLQLEGQSEDAYQAYKTISEDATVWDQERFLTQWEAARLTLQLSAPDEIVTREFLRAFTMRPIRAEPLYELAVYFRLREQFSTAYVFATAGASICFPDNDTLAVMNDIYHWKLLFEVGTLAKRIGLFQEGQAALEALMDRYDHGLNLPEHVVEELKAKLDFYKEVTPPPLKRASSQPNLANKDLLLGNDQVYVINLDRRRDRRQRISAVMDKLGVAFKRVPAVDGSSEITEKYRRHHKIKELPDYVQSRNGRSLTKGEIGCFMSHYRIWKDVLAKNYTSQVIVLEDDASFVPQFRSKLAETMAEMERLSLDWDLLYLGRRILTYDEKWVDDSRRLVHIGYSLWTTGYMLSPRGASILTKEEPLSKMVPVDEYLSIMFGGHPDVTVTRHFRNRNLRAYSVHPLLIWQTDEGPSSDTAAA
jgi:GR25 family glycosyltransferase involved in LPS biosynthesis